MIFRLPAMYGIYQHPLAYVYWFKSFTSPAPDIEMYHLSLSSHNHRQRASIIPITQIVRSCHLIPAFGKEVDLQWASESVLENATHFYLNPYLRHHDFFLFRYLVDRHKARGTKRLQVAVQPQRHNVQQRR